MGKVMLVFLSVCLVVGPATSTSEAAGSRAERPPAIRAEDLGGRDPGFGKPPSARRPSNLRTRSRDARDEDARDSARNALANPEDPELALPPASTSGAGNVVKISGPMSGGGDVLSFDIGPNNAAVVYLADQIVDGFEELFSVPVIGGAPPIDLNGPMPPAGTQGGGFLITPDGSRVVYISDQDTAGTFELYSVPVGGGTVTKLNPPLVFSGDVLFAELSPDGSRMVYLADQEFNDRDELYSVPVAGGPATKLNPTLPAGGDVDSFLVTQDSSTVIYAADQDTESIDELYLVPITGGAPAAKLNDPLVFQGEVRDYEIAGGDVAVVYLADQETFTVEELYSIANSPGAEPIKLNAPMVEFGDVDGFRVSPDATRVVYLADQEVDDVENLYSVSLTAGPATKLNPPLAPCTPPPGVCGTIIDFAITPDSARVYYLSDQYTDSERNIYSVPVEGGPLVTLSGPMIAGGDVSTADVSPDGTRVFYLADQEFNGMDELYSVPITGGPQVKLNDPLPANSDVDDFLLNSNASIVFYLAQQDAIGVNELYFVPALGSTAPVKLSAPLVPGGDVEDFEISAGDNWVVYSADQEVNGTVELFSVPFDFADADADGVIDPLDCDPDDGQVWAVPGEVPSLALSHTGGAVGTTTIEWAGPEPPGGTSPLFDTVVSATPASFLAPEGSCVEVAGNDTMTVDATTPGPGAVRFFLVRASNPCGPGTTGTDSAGDPRSVLTCP